MTKQEHKDFTRDFCNGVAEAICEKIEEGKVPETWEYPQLIRYIIEQASTQLIPRSKEEIRQYVKDLTENSL